MTHFNFRYVQTDGRVLDEHGREVGSDNEESGDMMEIETLTDFNRYSTSNPPAADHQLAIEDESMEGSRALSTTSKKKIQEKETDILTN